MLALPVTECRFGCKVKWAVGGTLLGAAIAYRNPEEMGRAVNFLKEKKDAIVKHKYFRQPVHQTDEFLKNSVYPVFKTFTDDVRSGIRKIAGKVKDSV